MARSKKQQSRGQKRKAKLAKRQKKQKARADSGVADLLLLPQFDLERFFRWSPDIIEELETEEIAAKLGELGASFSDSEFRKAAERCYGPRDLAEELWYPNIPNWRDLGADGDFPWMAAIVLWDRLCPEIVNTRGISDKIELGDSIFEELGVFAGCNHWLEIWDTLKERFLRDITSVDDLTTRLGDYLEIGEWLDELIDKLDEAGVVDPKYLNKRIALCREVCELLPDSDPVWLREVRCALADSWFMLGDVECGEAAYQETAELHPTDCWVYINWADMWTGQFRSQAPPDHDKAMTLFSKAAELADPADRETIDERIEDLNAMKQDV